MNSFFITLHQIAQKQTLDGDWILNTHWIVGTSPILGRLAFAGVFIILIAWLLWIPAEKLKGNSHAEPSGERPSAAGVRFVAIAIAAIQAGLYLFWF